MNVDLWKEVKQSVGTLKILGATIHTFPNWINWGTILSTVDDGMANPTPADVPAKPFKFWGNHFVTSICIFSNFKFDYVLELYYGIYYETTYLSE